MSHPPEGLSSGPATGPQAISPDDAAAGTPQALLTRALNRAWWALMWERLWPRLSLAAAVLGAFLIVSWAGLWTMLPPLGRAVGLGLFALAFAASLYPLFRLAQPSHAHSLRRVDAGSGLPHRPATAMTDRLAAGSGDAGSAALWQAHVARATAGAQALRAGAPHPGLARRDPFALRALVLLLLVATFVAAGGERLSRITTAFDWRGAVATADFRIDAWVTPPHYTGRPPVLLPGIRAGEPLRESQTLSVPAGSVLVVRATGIALDLSTQGLTETVPAAGGSTGSTAGGAEERRFAVTESGWATLRGVGGTLGGGSVTWTISAIPDNPPTIELARDPEPQAGGSVQFTYRVEDDYGVVQAEAILAPRGGTPAAEADGPPRPLYDPPNFGLALPQARTRSGAGQTTRDMSSHPWAGADVVMTLIARDDGGNEGRSAPHEFRLPQRSFRKPLARALIEQRRMLALDAEARARVQRALEALTIAPERFTPEAGIYLGLRSVYWMLANARNDDELRGVVDRLWAMAVLIEDGSVSDAEQALRAAQEALRQALEQGASEEELQRLMDDLRAALDKFMQALAEELRQNPDMARPLDRNAQEMRPQDLNRMLDRMEELARSGATDAARRMLDQLQAMLENLQMARPGQQGEGDDMSALDELGDMIRREQQLRDRAFREGQDQRRQRGQQGQRRPPGQQGQQGEQGEPGQSMQGMQREQQALRERLEQLLEEMRRRGQSAQQPGEGGDPLGEAEQAMRDAEGALGEGDADGAVESQGRAIDAMRRGAQSLAQQMQQQQGEGQGEGPGPGEPGRSGRQRAQQQTDPLGRPLRGRDYGDDVTVRVPGEIDVQRARRILEELRRRLSDPLRPQLELDYLERLLRDF